MWKPEHRHAAERHGLRYPSDLTDVFPTLRTLRYSVFGSLYRPSFPRA